MDERRELWWECPTKKYAKVVPLSLEDRFETVMGGAVDEIQVAYESWGELSPQRDNVVIVAHPLTTDCHLTGEFQGQERGWWEGLFGPGRAIDTDRFHVVCPNLLGSCYGTTGPRFPAPDGEPYLKRFPLLTPLDLMRFQKVFLQELGIEKPRAVIGPSMGGMIAWEWAVEGGENVGTVIVVAAPPLASANEIGLNWLQRRGVEIDLVAGGVKKLPGGQAVGRGIGMLSYRAPEGMAEKFGREWFKKPGATLEKPGTFNVESWLKHHGRRSVKRFDPYTYLLLSRTMDLHDLSEGRGSLEDALSRVQARLVAVGISSDQLYPACEVRAGVDILRSLGKEAEYAEIRSPHGHDAFLLEIDQVAEILGREMERS